MREGSGMPPPWEVSMLENEFLQVLDDLDSTLAQEQFASSVNTSMPHNYGSRTQFSPSSSIGNRDGHITGRHKNRYNETSNTSIYDILRPGTPREGFKTFSPRTRTIYDMYRTREPRVLNEDYAQKNTFGSTSLCFDSRQRSAPAATRHFTARSLHFPAATQSKSRFIPPYYQQIPKRTPLSSIVWNRSDSSRDRQNQEEFLRAPSPMEIDPADQYVNPGYLQGNRRYEMYNSQNAYRSIHLNAPMDDAVSSDTSENSENMPCFHQDNPFARSFFSGTFRRSREQFGQSSFWGHQEEHFSWSDFHQSRKPFVYSDRDFEMISTEASRAPTAHGHSVPFLYSKPFSPGDRTNVFRGQEEPSHWQSDFHTPPLESMEISHCNVNQMTPHFGTQNICSMSSSRYHIKSSALEYQQDSSPIKVHINKEPYSSRLAQTLTSSSKTFFPQIPDDKGNSQSPTFLNSTVTLQKVIPNKPDSLPAESHTEVTMTYSNPTDPPPPLPETQPNILVTEINNEKDSTESILEDKQLNKMDQTDMTGEIPQPVSQTDRQTDLLPDFQKSFSQDPTKNDRLGFNGSTIVSSKGSPRGFSRKDTSKMHVSYRDKPNELKKNESFPGNRKLNSAASLLFTQRNRIPPSFPSPDQSCHQKLTGSNEDISDIVKNSWHSEPLDNQNTELPAGPADLDLEGEQSSTTHSTSCNKLVARHNISCDSLDLSRLPPDSSPSNDAFFDAFVIPATTVYSRSQSDTDPSLGERENASKNQNNQVVISSLDSQKNNDSHMPINDEIVTCHSYCPFKSGSRKGRIRRHISYIEKLSRMNNTSLPTSESSSLIKENQSKSKPSELNTIYCTLPRKSASCLMNGRQPGSKIMATSMRNGPPPFQIKNNMDDPGRNTSNEFSPVSPESMSKCSTVVSDSASVASKATATMTSVKVVRPASVRKGPLPYLIQRAKSCPSHSSPGREDRKKSLVSDARAFVVTPRPWERIMQSNLSIRDGQKEFSQECTEKDGKITASASGTSVVTLSDEDPVPFCAEVSEKDSGKTLHKFKTTSMFSVSGNEDNVQCLEVVSIYYTLPRKPSKKFCDLLQQYTRSTNSLTESLQVDTETFPNALEEDRVNYSTQEQSGTSSSEDLKIPANSTQTHLSHTTENMAVLQSPNRRSSGPTLQEMACVGVDVSLHKGESKTGKIFSHNLAKTPPGIPQSQKDRKETCKNETLHASLRLQDKSTINEKSEDGQQSINAGNSFLSGLPARSEANDENSQTGRSSGECAGSGTAIISTESGNWPQKDLTAIAIYDNASRSQPMEVRTEPECQKMIDKILSDSESQALVLTPTLHKLQFVDKTQPGEPDLESLQSEPRKLPQGRQEVNVKDSSRVKDEMCELAWDQTLHAGGNNKHNDNLNDLEKGENRSLVKHRLLAMSKASRKFPAKDLSPRRHVATIFSKSGNKSDFGHLLLDRQKCNSLAPEPTPKSTEPIDEGSLSNDGKHVEATEISSRETSRPSCSISKLYQPELSVSESPPKHENSISATVAEERESGTPAQLTFTSLREADLSDQRRQSPPFPLDPAQKSPISASRSSCQQQEGRDLTLEWEPEPHLYRSKSLKSINEHSDLPCKSHPPKVRGRHFSENTSIDNALSRLTLGDELSHNSGYSRRFKSFSELPSCDETESWALYSSKAKTGPKSASSISRPIDYGIFGKEQQLAFLENVKRSLTQGRLWKPSFLKNPGFLKDDVISSSNPSESLSSNSPSSQVPEDTLSPNEPLRIYEEDPVDSDCDTDTTTDDEYYLNENDKESEL